LIDPRPLNLNPWAAMQTMLRQNAGAIGHCRVLETHATGCRDYLRAHFRNRAIGTLAVQVLCRQ
jgi:hypothetical protein